MTDANQYPPCARRQRLVHFRQDGKAVTQRCLEQTAEHANRDVEPVDCEDCPVRKVLLQKDKKSGAYRPPATTVKLFQSLPQRKDTAAGDGYPPCETRLVVEIAACCGKKEELRVCDCPDMPRYGADVTPHICQQCPRRSSESS